MVLTQKLVEKNKITKEQAQELQKEFANFQGSEESFLFAKKIVNEEDINAIKAEIYNIPYFDKIELLEVSSDVLSMIPEDSARFYKIIPLALNGDVLDVGIVEPDNIKAREVLNFLSRQNKIKYNTYVINENSFKSFLKKYRDIKEEVGKALVDLEKELGAGDERFDFDAQENKLKADKFSEDAPIIKMVAVILRHAVDGGASDIHIEPEEKQMRVRFRMDGNLFSSLFLPIHTHASIVARIKILSNLRIDETRIPQDGRFGAKIDNKSIDFRVSTFPTKLGEKVVIRVLDPTENLKSYEEIGLSKYNLVVLKESVSKPFGLILATGPTGSGKTTTLYTILRELNKPDVNVVTLEDPIEYFIPGVNQSQVRPEIGYDFSQGLRSVVRQDPDIIMVGEIRDEESASLSTHAALTGHIVLSTLHTNNAIGSISRLIDMKVKPFLVPATLNIAIGQRLAHTLCPYCKQKVRPVKEVENEIIRQLNDLPEKIKSYFEIPKEIFVYKPKGCPKCSMKGEKGRVGVFEVLKMTPELERIIIEDYSTANIAAETKKQGMITMRQDGLIKALEGIISVEEAFRVTEEQKI
ncbi:MAG: Type II secretion system protein E [Parcubacteria bacterium 32_520]|nr:MAG: Type II secretion system protein E [Parcubacteria bacterium 33_209]KUK99212.1 MAG: Type II secretion system protein E [Parcubacteria bacterium 32_520]